MRFCQQFFFYTLAVVFGIAPLIGTAAVDRGTRDRASYDRLTTKAEIHEARANYRRAAKYYARSIVFAPDKQAKADLAVRQADCLFNADKTLAACEVYQDILQSYPLYVSSYGHVVSRLRILAEKLIRGEGTFLGLRDMSKGVDIYALIVSEAPAAQAAVSDYTRLGFLEVEMGRPEDAVEAYEDVLKLFPETAEAGDAHFELGFLLIELSETGDGDGRMARRAVRHLKTLSAAYPNHSRRADARLLLGMVDEREAARLYQLGEFYLRPVHRRQKAAIRYLSDAIRDYPDAAAAIQARLLLASVEQRETEAIRADKSTKSEVPTSVAAPVKPPPQPQARPQDLAAKARMPKPRVFRRLLERENLKKWLLPLPEIGELDAGEIQNEE